MTVSKTPKVLILFAILALAGATVVAGCGGGGSSTAETSAEESAAPPAEEGGAEEEPAEEEGGTAAGEGEEEMEGGGGAAMGGEGKAVFSANCATCHTLKAAGATGTVGPNLDELKPSEETVEKQVITGGGPMPAFGNKEILTPAEIEAVSEYVSAEAGK
jgi:mono/diheme cytochrome c family protein